MTDSLQTCNKKTPKVYDLDSFILVIHSDDRATTVGKDHPNYVTWATRINQPKQLSMMDGL
jgi:hypothetical protein